MQIIAPSAFVELTQRLIEASKNWFRRRAAVNEIATLDSEELSCIAHELGISAAELRVLAKPRQKRCRSSLSANEAASA